MKRLLMLLPVFALTFSCTDNNDNPFQQPEVDNFYALTLGNSWVYKNYKDNLNSDVYDDTGVIDSISIVGTEEFNGNTYYKFRRLTTGNEAGITFCNENGEHFEFLRDSLGYLVRNDGRIKFTNNDFSERAISENSGVTTIEALASGTTQQAVEAGSFSCIHSERFARNANGDEFPGRDRYYYSDGFGLIYDTSSYVSQEFPTIIRRLDTYNIQ